MGLVVTGVRGGFDAWAMVEVGAADRGGDERGVKAYGDAVGAGCSSGYDECDEGGRRM